MISSLTCSGFHTVQYDIVLLSLFYKYLFVDEIECEKYLTKCENYLNQK